MTTPSHNPRSEIRITEHLVRALLREQAPQYAELPLVHAADGWDNSIWRLGDRLAVRLPRRQIAVDCLLNEQKWLPRIADQLPVSVPVPRSRGRASQIYRWPWSVVDWFSGTTAADAPLGRHQGQALGQLLGAIHRPAPTAAPRNEYRGVPLARRRNDLSQRLKQLRSHRHQLESLLQGVPDHQAIEQIFEQGTKSAWKAPPVWLHGDLHPKNVLVERGAISALIDWGDICAGDPASDLSGVWMLLPTNAHSEFLKAYGLSVSSDLWQRARGWAAQFAVLLLLSGIEGDDPGFRTAGANTWNRVLRPYS